MRIALDARVSTSRQAQAQAIEQRLERLQAHVQAHGETVAERDVFRDADYSGASLSWPELDQLRDRAALAEGDWVVVAAPDRLARRYVHQVLLIEELQAHGCTVEFLERPTSQDPHDQLLLQIRGAVAEYGRMLICDRLRRGRLTHLRAGQLLSWSRAPFGYQLDPDHPRDPACLHLDPAAANLRAYIAGFSDNMREVLEKFGFDATFAKLAEANLPCQVTERFKCPSGRVLVRRFGLDQAPEPRDEDHIDDLPAAGQVGATTDRLSPSAWTSPDSEGALSKAYLAAHCFVDGGCSAMDLELL